MSTASVSPHGFAVVRRGYRMESADAYITTLSRDRDDAWERAARLTVLAKEMEAEAVRLREIVEALPTQTYEALGRRAQYLLAVTLEESEEVRTAAHGDALAAADAARADERRMRDAARAVADSVRAGADAHAEQVLLAARASAEETLSEARAEAKDHRTRAAATWQDTRHRAEDLLAGLEAEQAARWDALERDLAGLQTESDARLADLTSLAEASLADAERVLAEAREQARHAQEDADARAAELLAQAHAREDRTARETERLLREHEESREEMNDHMSNVRDSLAALTGRASTE
ncbi:cellulose-binding protein [Streptomyces sp. NPDC055078]